MNPDEPKSGVKATDPKPEPAAAKPEVKVAVPLVGGKTEAQPQGKADPKKANMLLLEALESM